MTRVRAVGVRINLLSFYFVGTPVTVGLAFSLGVGFDELWYGLLTAQAVALVLVLAEVLLCTDLEMEALRAKKLTNVEVVVMSEEERGAHLIGDSDDHKEGVAV
ncbi:hypothetical protein Cni_G22254 [Canna indica]|uniref:Uncharacterized protein n=1 Tax=Canna indica TaxID=4628 RepID=A0AAQ3QJE5_9LILI|nr:hypothetical protein Cni_G22254 [Canna indica]